MQQRHLSVIRPSLGDIDPIPLREAVKHFPSLRKAGKFISLQTLKKWAIKGYLPRGQRRPIRLNAVYHGPDLVTTLEWIAEFRRLCSLRQGIDPDCTQDAEPLRLPKSYAAKVLDEAGL